MTDNREMPMVSEQEGMPRVGFDLEAEKEELIAMGAKITNPKELGASYFTMRALGVKPLAAYKIVESDMERFKNSLLSPPPKAGKINSRTMEAKSFYSPDEVDRMTEEDLKNEKLLKDVMKSMSRWKNT